MFSQNTLPWMRKNPEKKVAHIPSLQAMTTEPPLLWELIKLIPSISFWTYQRACIIEALTSTLSSSRLRKRTKKKPFQTEWEIAVVFPCMPYFFLRVWNKVWIKPSMPEYLQTGLNHSKSPHQKTRKRKSKATSHCWIIYQNILFSWTTIQYVTEISQRDLRQVWLRSSSMWVLF